jgi:hypothetical protein
MRRVLIVSLLASTGAMAQVSAPLVSQPSFTGVSEPLHTIAMRAQTNAFTVGEFRLRREHTREKVLSAAQLSRASGGSNLSSLSGLSSAAAVSVNAPAAYNQTTTVQALGAPIGANFEALGLGTPGFTILGAPPDTTLAVSPTQIVQWVNSQVAVYNKAGVPQLPAPGFVLGSAFWAGMPANSLCKQFNRGDPMVQYDRINQRWILSQFAFNAAGTDNAQCFAVSQTSNAMGAYNLYEYNFGADLPDYGKIGLWPDAMYMSYNMFGPSSFNGAKACAYDKAAMYAGGVATQICFTSLDDFSLLPSDLDGTTLPPPGTPNIFVSWNWYNTAPPYTMQLRKFVPNFGNPALSTFDDGFGGASFSSVDIVLDANTLAACNDGTNFACVPQLGTARKLDTLADRHMYRLAYRNFGSYQSLLVTQAVDPDAGGTAKAQLRWWEIRNPASNPPVVYQNSTFNPSTDSRWMSSAAFDKRGNMGVGYSASSATINPGIRVSGRLKNDPKNMLRTEVLVQAGGGSQTATTHTRWGDYSTMQIDPVDDCTFWYTTQYIAASGSFVWHTRIASFKFPNCS